MGGALARHVEEAVDGALAPRVERAVVWAPARRVEVREEPGVIRGPPVVVRVVSEPAAGQEVYVQPGAGSRSMLDLWRRRFDFLLWRRGRLLFGSRLSGHRLAMGSRRWSRLGRGDFLRRCLYLRGRFWRRFAGPPCRGSWVLGRFRVWGGGEGEWWAWVLRRARWGWFWRR